MTGWGSGSNNYCIGVEGEIVTSIDAVGRDSVNMRADIQSNNYQMNAVVGTLTLSEGAVVNITTSHWGTGRKFGMLTLSDIQVQNKGMVLLNVGADNGATVKNIDGVLGSVSNAGTLILGEEGGNMVLGGTLNNTGTMQVLSTLQLSPDIRALERHNVSETYSNAATGNGYATVTGSFYVAKNVALNQESISVAGSEERLALDTTSVEGATLVNSSYVTDEYYVNNGSVIVRGENSEVAEDIRIVVNGGTAQLAGNALLSHFTYNSGSILVGAGHTLTVDQATDSATFCALEGSGDVRVEQNVTLGAEGVTQATGDLTIANGARLQLGQGNGHNASIASFRSVTLDNGFVNLHNASTSINNMKVSSGGGAIHLDDMNWNQTLSLAGETELEGAFSLSSTWKGIVDIEKVSGTGNMTITSWGNPYNNSMTVNIETLEDYSGDIQFNGGSQTVPATLNIGSIGSMGALTNSGAATILNIGADENSVHNLSHTMTVEGTLSLQGTINISEDLSNFLLKEEGTITSYSEGEDGYAYTSGSKYTIVDIAGGTLATPAETLAGMNERLSVYEDGDIVYTAGEVLSSVYHVRTKDITLGGTNGSVAANEASQMVVAEGRTITVEGDMPHLTAADIVLSSMGAGNLHLKTNASLSGNAATQLTGKLTVSNDALLWIGSGSNSRILADSFSSVVLEQGTLGVSTSGSSINNLTVKENGGRLRLYATGQDEAFTIKGDTVLEGDFEIFTNGWDCSSNTVQMETVTGSGDMTITSYTSAYGAQLKVEIDTLKDYTGDVLFNSDGRQSADLIIASIESMGKLTAYGTSGRVQLGAAADSVLNIDQTMTIGGRLTMQGSINLSEDLDGYKVKELGQVIRWSEQENGYAITKDSTYILADLQGGTLTNTAEELLAMNNKLFLAEDGDVVFIGGEHQGTTYYLRTRDVTVGGSNGHAAAASALQFDVAKGCTLTIAGTSEHDTTGELVANTTGQGNILLTADATLMDDTVTQGTGTLRVQGSGTTLQVGNNQYTKVDISSFNQIALEDGAEIVFLTSEATVQNFQVAAGGGTLMVSDLGTGNMDAVHLTGDTCLLGDLKLGNTYNAQILVDSLRGNGDIIVDSQRLSDMYFTATSAADWKGNLYADFNGKSAGGLKATIGGDWTGTAYISNSYGGSLDLTGYGSKATVSLSGNKTALQVDSATNAADIESAVCLNGTNEINDGPLGARLNFKGAVSGAGVLKLSADASAEQLHLNFSGDTSRWTGSMEVAAGEHTVSFSKAATTVNNTEIKATGAATLHLNVGNTEAEITVNSAITYDADATLELYVNNSADTIFANTVQASSVRTAGKGMTTFLEEVSAADIVLNGATMFTSTVVGDVQALATGSLMLGNAPVTIDGSFTGDVATLNLSKVYITSALLAEGEAALQPIVLLTTTGALTVENIDTLVPGRLGLVYDEELYRAFLTLESSEDGSNALVLNVEAIPEPATATLSLLALAALASRRRRH